MSGHLDEIAAAYDGDDGELRAMIERGEAIGDLMQHPGWEHFADWLKNVAGMANERLLSGKGVDFPTYQRLCGMIAGIQQALDPLTPIQLAIDARQRKTEPDEPAFPWHEPEPEEPAVSDDE